MCFNFLTRQKRECLLKNFVFALVIVKQPRRFLIFLFCLFFPCFRGQPGRPIGSRITKPGIIVKNNICILFVFRIEEDSSWFL